MTMNSAPVLPAYSEDELAALSPSVLIALLIRDEDRVGDPCPCGSGKKYKKCCLPRAQA